MNSSSDLIYSKYQRFIIYTERNYRVLGKSTGLTLSCYLCQKGTHFVSQRDLAIVVTHLVKTAIS